MFGTGPDVSKNLIRIQIGKKKFRIRKFVKHNLPWVDFTHWARGRIKTSYFLIFNLQPTVQSPDHQTALWGFPGRRFKPGKSDLVAGTLNSDHYIDHHTSYFILSSWPGICSGRIVDQHILQQCQERHHTSYSVLPCILIWHLLWQHSWPAHSPAVSGTPPHLQFCPVILTWHLLWSHSWPEPGPRIELRASAWTELCS